MPDSTAPYREMPVHDEFVPEDLFSEFMTRMPQVCVDLLFETDEGILLTKRTAYPRVWFWPGSRLYKGERLEAAAHRIAREELGVEVRILNQYGPYEHFWHNSGVEGSPSRHTVTPAFHVEPANDEFDITLDDQHDEYRFITELEDGLHEYVTQYLEDTNLLSQ